MFATFPLNSFNVDLVSCSLGTGLTLDCDNLNAQRIGRININTPSPCDYTTSTSSLRLHNLPDARLGGLAVPEKKAVSRQGLSANLRPA